MKKALPILLVLAFLGLVLQVAVNVFVKEKKTEYSLKTDDNTYEIEEHLEVVDGKSYYNFMISDKDKTTYSLFLDYDLNKQTNVIKDIKSYSSNDLKCIFPIFRRDVTENVTCLYKGEAVSYDYLKQIGNQDINSIITELKESEYKHNSWDRATSGLENLNALGRSIDYYKDNLLKDYIFLVWRYQGLYILKSDGSVLKDYLDYDIYDNTMSYLVDRYYVSALKNDAGKVAEFIYYNTKELGKGSITLPNITSNDYYFNGVYKHKLYLTDVGNSKQYAIDPAYEKVSEVGNDDKGFINIVDGKEVNVASKEFLASKYYFDSVEVNEEITKKYGNVEIKKDRDFYYFKTIDGKVYRAYEGKIESAEILFQFGNITEWKVKNGDILFAAGDVVYFYSDHEGLVPIAINKELNYNNKNIIDFWRVK